MNASIGGPPEAPGAIAREPSADERPTPRRDPEAGDPVAGTPDVHEICPYLAAAGGAWRSASPHREHRCRAVEPPAQLTSDKQRRLCLSAQHAGCPTFRAARASRAAMLAPGVDPAAVAAADAARRPIARSSALILEHPRLSAPTARWPVNRAMSQVVLVGLMIVAVLAVAVARFAGPQVAAVAVPSASASPTASPTPRPTPRLTPSPLPSASASTGPSASPSGAVSGVTATPNVTASPSATATPSPAATPDTTKVYVVKKGDTLYGIASTFGTTVAELKRINGLTSNNLKIGQKLKLP
jgi:LysM repeat protein